MTLRPIRSRNARPPESAEATQTTTQTTQTSQTTSQTTQTSQTTTQTTQATQATQATQGRTTAPETRLHADGIRLAYDRRVIVDDLRVAIPDHGFTVIVGPNACGKSTLLRALARMLNPKRGAVYLDGKQIGERSAKDVARRLGLLPQTPVAPDGITVVDLVARGRYPHQGLLRQWSAADETAIQEAMAATQTTDLAGRYVDELSGGQRQRVWLALALAQQTDLLLLDEPTTFLDIAHQLEVLDLCADLRDQGRCLVAVLHDLNHACRYATHLIAMRDGRIVAEGEPARIVTEDLVRDVFGLASRIISDPESGTPLVVPATCRRPTRQEETACP